MLGTDILHDHLFLRKAQFEGFILQQYVWKLIDNLHYNTQISNLEKQVKQFQHEFCGWTALTMTFIYSVYAFGHEHFILCSEDWSGFISHCMFIFMKHEFQLYFLVICGRNSKNNSIINNEIHHKLEDSYSWKNEITTLIVNN